MSEKPYVLELEPIEEFTDEAITDLAILAEMENSSRQPIPTSVWVKWSMILAFGTTAFLLGWMCKSL